jgi:outer membrane protein
MVVAGASVLTQSAFGQAPARPAAESTPHKIGLIDMAHIFKEYKKFVALRDDLKGKIEESDSKAKALATQIKGLQAELSKLTSGSPEYSETERKLAEAGSKFETFRKLAQSEFLREESQIYKTIYLEVTDMVEKYAKHYNYTLVMRFSREGLESDEPGNVIKGMNRQVVFFRTQDDITQQILEVLNKRYESDGGAAPRAARAEEAGPGKKSAPR